MKLSELFSCCGCILGRPATPHIEEAAPINSRKTDSTNLVPKAEQHPLHHYTQYTPPIFFTGTDIFANRDRYDTPFAAETSDSFGSKRSSF